MLMRWSMPTSPMWDRPFYGNLFGDVFESFIDSPRSVSAGPRFFSKETDSELIISADVPGSRAEDLSVTWENSVLTISCARRLEVPEGYRVLRSERTPIRFARRVTIEDAFDPEQATASLEGGVLTLRIPRRPEAQPRRIPISTR